MRRSSPMMHVTPGHSGPLQKCAVVVGCCWVLLGFVGGGGRMMCLFISNFASVMWL